MSATIDIEALGKSYDGKPALEMVDLSIRAGEMIALLGASGCGKTTLLRCIAGLALPDRGRILFGGRDVTHMPTQKRPIGMVFQAYALFPNMTVAENIGFPLKVRGVAPAKIHARAEELIALVGLSERAGHYPNQLSGGQQQRTALARALAADPEVLLLDEPLSALDAVVRDHLRDEIRRIQQRVGTTAIIVTHDQSEALAMADRVAVMRAGRIEEVASPAALYDRPASAFTAGFIGGRNRLDLPVRNGRARIGAIEFPVAATVSRVGIFVRAEDVHRRAEGGGEPAEIEARLFQGQTTRFYLTLHGEEGPLRLRVDWPSRETAGLAPGDRVHVAIEPGDAHVFPL
ncbi:ABC transporter ATP-binding protein [Aureimonas endophytica]|uniref:ABC transporter ATP-binding protein n=1 Tax=Aureimonas endophytica TaxID=2027858 RepID=A0A917E6B0_9HYPH|nr:ABC transporter ATP-binding protein [Aureimonas endophytica]GGE04899.1 ABC transporter ATP-binding protein [Aureimonas endophytica]